MGRPSIRPSWWRGTAPDVIDVQGGLWLEYAANGGLVDLDALSGARSGDEGPLTTRTPATWNYEGKQYMVPFYISKTLLFYNKTHVQGGRAHRPAQSFDELLEFAQKMGEGEKSGFITLNFDWLYWPLFAMNGVELLSAGHEEGRLQHAGRR